MGTPTKTLHGARIWLFGPDATEPLGVFESIAVGVNYDHFEPYILGRVSGGEVVLTAMQPIMLRLGGFRKIDEGPFSERVGMMMLQDFFADDAEFTCLARDRVTGKDVMVIFQSKIVGENFQVAARNPARLEIEIVGLRFKDEAGDQDEPVGSATY